jgi:hypothetical protein
VRLLFGMSANSVHLMVSMLTNVHYIPRSGGGFKRDVRMKAA